MQVARTRENLRKCKCMYCPSYTTECRLKNLPGNLVHLMEDLKEADHFEGMFCAFEKSNCIHKDKGCLCETCPIHDEYQLNNNDYCLHTGGETPKN